MKARCWGVTPQVAVSRTSQSLAVKGFTSKTWAWYQDEHMEFGCYGYGSIERFRAALALQCLCRFKVGLFTCAVGTCALLVGAPGSALCSTAELWLDCVQTEEAQPSFKTGLKRQPVGSGQVKFRNVLALGAVYHPWLGAWDSRPRRFKTVRLFKQGKIHEVCGDESIIHVYLCLSN